MRVAYADPPYKGQAQKHYSHDPRCAEVDHARLIWRLTRFDAFALSCKSDAAELEMLLRIARRSLECRGKDVKRLRVSPWVKPFCSFKPGINPAYAWEPVIWWSSRHRTREQQTVRDWVSANITLRKGLAGAKPHAFCYWLFELLNLQPDDEFIDLYPGTGVVTEAWGRFADYMRGTPMQLSMVSGE
jgi:hypothetical protein